jgi:hypothetical protein
MFPKLLALDEFLSRDLVRPFHLVASVFALLLAAAGCLIGFALMVQSFLLGLFVVLLSAALGGALFLGVRLAAEAVISIGRMHERFIGGRPGDPIPPA